jgi:hypothetical protein
MAVEQAPAGSVLNAVGEEGVPVSEIAQAIGRNLNLSVKSLLAEEYAGMLVPLLSTDMPRLQRHHAGVAWLAARSSWPCRGHRTGPLLHLISPDGVKSCLSAGDRSLVA